MALVDDIKSDVSSILHQKWDIRNGQVVPSTEDVALAGGGVNLDATILYADLADSTDLAMRFNRKVAAKVVKCFLASCSRIIREHEGEIRSFDGDRVMGIFIGDNKNTSAAKSALKINYAVRKILVPKIENKYDSIKTSPFKLRHCTGIDTSELLTIRSGIRNNNDLVWIGRAPNVAAKLSDIRDYPYCSYVTSSVYDVMNGSAKYRRFDKAPMWERRTNTWNEVEGIKTIYRSSWWWEP